MATPPTVLILDSTLGAMFVGVSVAGGLFGVSCVQAWLYYNSYPKDLWYIKLLVAVVLVFDFIHQALISHTLYDYTITNFNNPVRLTLLVWSLLVEVLFNGFTALLVQLFLTMRVWRLSGNNIPLTLVVLLLVFSEFGCVLAYVIKSFRFSTFAELKALKQLSITVNALAALGDVLIATVLCMVLHRSRTGFQRSDTMINKLIMFAVNTGLLTSVCAVASLISILLAPNTFIYICFFFMMGRLYSNSLLATLNARQGIRAAADNHTDNLSLSLKDLGKLQTMPSFNVGRSAGTLGLQHAQQRPHSQLHSHLHSQQQQQQQQHLPTQISIRITNTHEYRRDGDDELAELDVDQSSQATADKPGDVVLERITTDV